MAIFNKQSNFKKEANFSSVIIGADAPVLEVELNELQEIQRERLRTTLKAIFLDGVKGTGDYTYNKEASTLRVVNELIIIEGEILEITEGNVSAREGDTIYVEVWEDVVTCDDRIPKYGNISGTEYVDNYLIDSRIGIETSRRKQIRFKLGTTKPTKNPYIILGAIQNDTFTLLADSIMSFIGRSSDSIRPYKYITINSTSKRFNVCVSPKGALITEEVQNTVPVSPQIILQDPTGARWQIKVTDLGEVCTIPVATGVVTPNFYLQAIEPYAIIYKVGVTVNGELYTAPLCDLNIITDNNIGEDTTWSSSKIAQTFSLYNTELAKLKDEVGMLRNRMGELHNE